jgi:precorrin-2 dehydrogenase/sirohydrochlorin ferrochelatase
MRYYPVFLDLKGKKVVVVGGGEVATRKVQTLLQCGASVDVVGRRLKDKLKGQGDREEIRYLGGEFREGHLEDAFLVIAATDDESLNRRIGGAAQQRGILFNAVDQPADCTFIVPSIVNRGDLLIAISTSGKSPALAKKIRQQLESQFGREYEMFLKIMGRIREEVLSLGLVQTENSRIFQEVIDAGMLGAVLRLDRDAVTSKLKGILPERVNMGRVLEVLDE